MASTDDVPEIDALEAQARLERGQRMIDVREEDEHREARIPGAALLPMSELLSRYEEELPKDEEIVVQCRSGARSARVTQFLLNRGYRAVNLEGGILAWERQGLPLERGGEEGGPD